MVSYHYPYMGITRDYYGITRYVGYWWDTLGTRLGHVWDTFGLPYAAGCWPDAAGPGTSLSLEV